MKQRMKKVDDGRVWFRGEDEQKEKKEKMEKRK